MKSKTPLMRQYTKIKSRYPGAILLFRVGDFFETFEDDALKVASALGIILTKRSNGAASEVPLAGFPHHALETYLPKLIKHGYRVAVCDQVENPKFARGIVKREVTEVVSPGVNFSNEVVEDKKNNYLCAIYTDLKKNSSKVGVAFLDITTSEFEVVDVHPKEVPYVLNMVDPSEILMSKKLKDYKNAVAKMLKGKKVAFTDMEEWMFNSDYANQTLLGHFKTHSLKGFGADDLENGKIAASAILNYIEDVQKGRTSHIRSLARFNVENALSIDEQTKRNLEIIYPLNTKNVIVQGSTSKSPTLLSVIDRTLTSMGARLLFKWVSAPLSDLNRIKNRLDSVEEFYNNRGYRDNLRLILKSVGDMQRMITRIETKRANPKQVLAFGETLEQIPKISDLLKTSTAHLIVSEVVGKIYDLSQVSDLIKKSIDLDTPASFATGSRVIKKGYNKELDGLYKISYSAKDSLLEIQQKERKTTGISSLKIQYNKVFGYYIEISNANKSRVPDRYERKQTLTNAERYTIKELKDYEYKILNAEEKASELEQHIFQGILEEISKSHREIKETSHAVALIDVLSAFAEVAELYSYAKPIIKDDGCLSIENGRHPVLERLMLEEEKYVENNCVLNDENKMMLITGPNMAGKSSYLRQVGLTVFMAHIGSFVPASKAEICLVDKIFTRVGASDNLAEGESTFLVEMNETASILNNATEKSLALLDEIGRGTSTYDGLSLAWAISEYLHDNLKAKTLFATHYHELTELESSLAHFNNYNAATLNDGEKLVFLRKIEKGAAKGSYGIEVAKMTGIPIKVIERAKDILSKLEEKNIQKDKNTREKLKDSSDYKDNIQLTLFEVGESKIKEALNKIDIEKTTPVEAMMALVELKNMIKKK